MQREQGLLSYLHEQLEEAADVVIHALHSPLIPIVFLLPYMPLIGVLPLFKFFQPFSYYFSYFVTWVWLGVGLLLFITKRLPEKSITVAIFVGVIFALLQRNSLLDESSNLYLLFMHSCATYAAFALGLSLCYHFCSESVLVVLTAYFSVATLLSLCFVLLSRFGFALAPTETFPTLKEIGPSAKESFLFLQEKNFEVLALTPCIFGASLLYLKKKTACRKYLALGAWMLVFLDALIFKAILMFPLLFIFLFAFYFPESKLASISTRLILILTCVLISAFIASIILVPNLDFHRKAWWTRALEVFLEVPLIGKGSSPAQHSMIFDDVGVCHNFYLYLLSQGGIISLFSFLLLSFGAAHSIEHKSGTLKGYFTILFPAYLLTFSIDGFDAYHCFSVLIPLLACFHSDDLEKAPLRFTRATFAVTTIVEKLGSALESFAKHPASIVLVVLPLTLEITVRRALTLLYSVGLNDWQMVNFTFQSAKVLAVGWFMGMLVSRKLKGEHLTVFMLILINIIWTRRYFVFSAASLESLGLNMAILIAWLMALTYQTREGLVTVTSFSLVFTLINLITTVVYPLGMYTGDLTGLEVGSELYTNSLSYFFFHKNSVVLYLFSGAISTCCLHLIYRKKITFLIAWFTLLSMTLSAYLQHASTAFLIMLLFCFAFFVSDHGLFSNIHPIATLKTYFVFFFLFCVLRVQFLIPGWSNLPAKIATLTRRTDLWEIAMGLIAKNPIFGSFVSDDLRAQLFDNPLQPGSTVTDPHNLFIENMITGGIISFIFLLVLFYFLAYKLEQAARTKSAIARFLFWVGLAMSAQVFVESLSWNEFTLFPALACITCINPLIELELLQKIRGYGYGESQ